MEDVADMKQSDRMFIAEYYRKNYHNLYLHAYSMLGCRAKAEVAMQEAFLVVCKKPEEFMAKENPEKWLEKTIENKALHILREEKYTKTLFASFEDLAPGQEPSSLDGNDFELIEFCQSVVSKDELRFFLKIAEGSSTFIDEAERLGIKLTACYKRFERIRDKLQKALGEYNKPKL